MGAVLLPGYAVMHSAAAMHAVTTLLYSLMNTLGLTNSATLVTPTPAGISSCPA
jgi:hypothetical protein